MSAGLSRRGFLVGSMLALPAVGLAAKASDHGKVSDALGHRCQEWERRHGGRIGVAVWNLATGYRAGHRVDERFLMCSTFKALAAALVLARVIQGQESLDRRLLVSRKDLVGWSPVEIGGKDFPFTPENATEFLSHPKRVGVLTQAMEFLASEKSFTPRSA